MILLDCNNAALGSILYIIKNIVNLIWIVGPILAIVSLAVNLTLLVKDPEDKKLPKKIKNSLFALIFLFLVPTIINASMSMMGEDNIFSSCWNSSYKVDFNSEYKEIESSEKTKPIVSDGYERGNPEESNDNVDSAEYNPNGPIAERIATAAEYYAWPEGTSKDKYCRFNGGGSTPQFMRDYRKYWPSFANSSDKSVAAGTCCCHFARTCVVKGIGKKFSFTLLPGASKDEYTKNQMAKLGFARITFDGKKSSLQRGDVLYYRNKGKGGHVWIYLGNNKAAEGAHDSGYGGRITRVSRSKINTSNKEVYYIFRAVQ